MGRFWQTHGLITSFLILNITSGVAAGIMQLIVPLYAMSINVSNAQLGLIKGISGLGLLLLVIPAGFLVDHYGSKMLFLIGGITNAIIAFCFGFAGSAGALVLLMGLDGFFRSLKFTSLNASFFRYLKTMGLEKSGWFKGSMSIGLTFIGPLLGGYLAKILGFATIFRIVVLIMLLPILLVFYFYNEERPERSGRGLKEMVGTQLAGLKLLLQEKKIHLVLLAEGISTGCFATFSTFIVAVLVKDLQLSAAVASSIIVLEGSVFVFTVFTGGLLIKYLSKLDIYLLGFGISALGLAGLSMSLNLPLIVLSTVVLGLGLGLINLITCCEIGELEGEKGKIAALMSAATGIGITLGPLFGGLIGEYFGNRAIFIVFVPFFFLLGVIAILTRAKAGGNVTHEFTSH